MCPIGFRLPQSRAGAYALSVSLLLVVSGLAFASNFRILDETDPPGFLLAHIAAFNLFLVEAIAVVTVGAILANGGPWARGSAYLLTAAVVIAHAIQLVASGLTVGYVSRLAVANAASLHLVLSPGLVAIVLGIAAGLSALVRYVETRPVARIPLRRLALGGVVALLVGGLAGAVPRLLPDDVRTRRVEFWALRGSRPRPPTVALGYALNQSAPLLKSDAALASDLEVAERFGIHYDATAEFPALGPSIYSTPPPFPRRDAAIEEPDVLVFLLEGLSARVINAYGSPHVGLTPNLDRFAAASLRVTDYFNHTAATYRGLHGQLCSLYPLEGGSTGWNWRPHDLMHRRYLCLNDLLADQGYETAFLDSYLDANSRTAEMLQSLGFGRVLSADDLSASYLNGEKNRGAGYLSDQQFMRSAIGFLEAQPSRTTGRPPIFTGLYNAETHIFLDVASDGVRYGDGSNIALNRIHNLDDAFGRFWDWFLASEYADSTIVVISADHAHYPELAYIEIAGADYTRTFVDAIPLMIYDPTRRLPDTLSADFATSIDLTPSIAHLMGLPNGPNPFQGRSIFERDRGSPGAGVVAFDHHVYIVDRDGIHRRGFTDHRGAELDSLHAVLERLYAVEQRNRVWPARRD